MFDVDTMQNNHKKESFKLLQLSDDSKSLTELELPQVTHQRKRKILRKTRNTSPHSRLGSGHHAHDASTSSDGLMSSACSSNLGIWIAIVMTCGWLFILSYMTAIVYAENRRLETQISKLSVTSQAVPDELQRWHESSKWLEQNQTAAMARLVEVDQKLAAIGKDMQAIRLEFKQKYDDSSDHEKVTMLEKNEANFGAQLKAFDIDVKSLKENNQELRSGLDLAQTTLKQIEEFVHSANSTFGAAAANPTLNRASVLDLIHNVTDETSARLNRLSVDLDTLTYNQKQMGKGLEDDLRVHKVQLDQLTENWANVTSQVVSIQNSLVKLRDSTNVAVTNNADLVPSATNKSTNSGPSTETPKNAADTLRNPLAAPSDTNNTMHS